MIDLSGVHLTLTSPAGPVHILKGIDLEVPAGTTLSIVGPSGSGKSSLMAIIGGIERASSGRVEIDGTDLIELDEDELAVFRRDRIGILFQSFHLVPTMTAVENVALPGELKGRRDSRDVARMRLDQVGLGDRLEHFPGQLSGGEQQRVALARAIVNEPMLLLADEPTGNLDGDTSSQMMDLLFRTQQENGNTLLLITHDPSLAAMCYRTTIMRDGLLDSDADAVT